jgi:hypothetical protein
MADSTPPSRVHADEDDESSAPEPSPRSAPSRPSARRPLRLIDAPMRPPSASHPPSEPRPVAGRPGADAGPDRPARVQLVAALLLLLVLVVVPLYLWRRPRAASNNDSKSVASALASVAAAAPTATAEPNPHTRNGVTVSDPKVIGCHDRGPKRTPASECDHLTGFEAAASKAILGASACAAGEPPGAIAFVFDASYGRRHNPVRVERRRDGTTLPSKVVSACLAEVKRTLAPSSMDATHGHSRYEIEIDATYLGAH